MIRRSHLLVSVVIAFVAGSCERHSWEETKELHHHGHGGHEEGHGDGYGKEDKDTGHGEGH